jgi:catechol 2,3-dioxygenase-like lactoylglutathione lyase family enzyme
MKPGSVLHVVRPTDNLAKIVKMYVEGLGFAVIAQFTDHEGFDGAILGHPQQPYHFAFTSQRGHHAGAVPTKHHLLVFYLPDENEWAESCRQIVTAGFQVVPSANPYWDRTGRTFEDVDGYRVVLQKGAWSG